MNASDDYYIIKKTNDIVEACYYVKNSSNDPLWKNHSALNTSLPFLLTQLFVVLFIDRLLLLILKPLRQPPIVAHIFCGIVLGPSLFAETQFSNKYFIPHKSTMVLETFGNLGLTYYMFLVGLEMEFSLIMQCGVQILSVTASGIFFPLLVGCAIYFVVLRGSENFDRRGSIFWAITLTSTNFPDLARILADLKLLRSNVGKIAMSSAILSDIISWLLLIVALSIYNGQKYSAFISTFGFILLCIFALRPAIAWLIERTSKGEIISDTHVWFIMAGVLLFGLTTDACGSHSIVGAFMFGAILPHDDTVKTKVVEKFSDFVTGILMPLFFLINGLRSDMAFMLGVTPWRMVLLVVCVSWAAKIVSVFFVSYRYQMSFRESFVLGMLMNTKGVLSLIILNTGRNIKVLNNQSFPLMILALLLMSCLIEPIIALVNKPTRKVVKHVNRSIKGSEPDTELRVLACVHSMRNVTGTLSLLNLSHGTQDYPLSIIAIHLIELSKRASTTMLIVHDDNNNYDNSYNGNVEENRHNRVGKSETSNIIRAFENYEKANNEVSVETMSVISPYTTMHVDICSLAEDKHVNLIIIPFHKEAKPDGTMGNGNINYANVNNNVLANTPCSVGVLADRGIGSKLFETQVKYSGHFSTRNIAMLFIGGPDDREALAYAWRMASHSKVCLTVARFFPVESENELNNQSNASANRERQLDNEHIEEFKINSVDNNQINYTELGVQNAEETISGIKALGENVFDLYVVGRRQGEGKSPVTEGLAEWGVCPELGTIGDTLVSSHFAMNASVLAVQHYISTDMIHEISDNFSTCSLGAGGNRD